MQVRSLLVKFPGLREKPQNFVAKLNFFFKPITAFLQARNSALKAANAYLFRRRTHLHAHCPPSITSIFTRTTRPPVVKNSLTSPRVGQPKQVRRA